MQTGRNPLFDPNLSEQRFTIAERRQKEALEQARREKIERLRKSGSVEEAYRAEMLEEYGD
jgi:hypothetical protein